MQTPNTVDDILSLAAATTNDQHYCQTTNDDPDLPSLIFIDHPLNDMSEVGVDPFCGYGIFRCPLCGDWWGNWLYRSAECDISDWYRFGPIVPTTPHRQTL